MKRSQRARRRSLMIETKHHRVSRTRRIRRKMPGFSWVRNLHLNQASTWGIVACALMVIFIAVAIFSPMFRVREFFIMPQSPFVEVPKVEEILQEVKGQNLLFLNKKDLRAVLSKEMPELRDIKITEKWPRALELRLDSSRAKYNVFNTETTNFSVISEKGVVLAEESLEGLPVIKIFQHKDFIKKRHQILSPEQLEKIYKAETIMDSDLMLPVTAVEVYLAANELHFISRGGMSIWLDLSRPVKKQLDKLVSAESKINLYKEKFEHIDLRIPQQVFWK